jgi:hypothetical protein
MLVGTTIKLVIAEQLPERHAVLDWEVFAQVGSDKSLFGLGVGQADDVEPCISQGVMYGSA